MGQVQFVGIAWRSCRGMTGYVGIGFLERVNHAQRCWGSPFVQIISEGLIYITLGLFTRNNRFGFHGDEVAGVT